MRSVARGEGDGKVVDLVSRRPVPGWALPDVILAAFSEAIRAVEPRSSDYWRVWEAYLRACGDASR
jgi:hypothetical protein